MDKSEEGYSQKFISQTKILQGIVCTEILMAIILISILHYSLIANLWDSQYIEEVREDWKKSPITQIKEIEANEDCSDWYMDKDKIYDGGDDEYTMVGQGKWWGLKKGCVCPSGSKWADVDTRQCMDE